MKEKQLNQDAIELCRRYFTKGSVLETPDKTERGLLKDLSDEYRTYEVCKIAVTANPQNLFSVPDRHKTKEMYTLAVKGEPSFAYLVPKNKLTEEICILALEHLNVKLSWVPKNLRTTAVCEAGIEKERGALKHAPTKAKSYSLCLKAVKNDGANIKHVPTSKLNDELCVTAIMQHPQAAMLIPENDRTYEVYLAMIKQGLIFLGDVPSELIDAQMCCDALKVAKSSSEVVPYLPINLLDNEKVQPLLATWLEKDAKEAKIEIPKQKSISEILSEATQPKEKLPKKAQQYYENNPREAYLDYYEYL